MAEPYMTIAEIEARYPNEWVFIANPTLRRNGTGPTGGVVVVHSPDLSEYYRLIGEWDDPTIKRTASWYTGKDWARGFGMEESESGVA